MKVFLRWLIPALTLIMIVGVFFHDQISGRLFPSGKRARWIREYLGTYAADPAIKRPSEKTCAEILSTGRNLLKRKILYDPAYQKILFPGGDVASDRGVCADIIVRSLRGIAIDLQKEVYEDRTRWPGSYPNIWNSNAIDTSIDHRRVPNLMTYLDRKHSTLPISSDAVDYSPCDIVAWDLGKGVTHIGIVTDVKSSSGIPLILHHISGVPVENDVLFRWEIIGHYSLLHSEVL